MHRRNFIVATLTIPLGGCYNSSFKPLNFPPELPVQQPMPGHAVVYLLRAPHDGESISVYLDQTMIVLMPPETYTAIQLKPGAYSIFTLARSSESQSRMSDGPKLTVSAGETRFLYTSIPTKSVSTLAVSAMGRAGVVPLFYPRTFPIGQRTWTECAALDAQGLMSIGKSIPIAHEML